MNPSYEALVATVATIALAVVAYSAWLAWGQLSRPDVQLALAVALIGVAAFGAVNWYCVAPDGHRPSSYQPPAVHAEYEAEVARWHSKAYLPITLAVPLTVASAAASLLFAVMGLSQLDARLHPPRA